MTADATPPARQSESVVEPRRTWLGRTDYGSYETTNEEWRATQWLNNGWAVIGPLVPEDHLRGAVVLDDDLLANLDERAARHNLDRNSYLRWVLTGKEPAKKGQVNA